MAGHEAAVRADWLERLFDRHAAEVLAYAKRRTDAATAEDVVAEVFLVAWRNSSKVPTDEPVLWLYGVARRLLANERRAGRRREALVAKLSVERDWHGDGATTRTPLLDALAALRAEDRELLMLSAWEGLDAGQIATVLGCSVQAVYQRLHRARHRLQAELESQAPAALQTNPTAETTAHD